MDYLKLTDEEIAEISARLDESIDAMSDTGSELQDEFNYEEQESEFDINPTYSLRDSAYWQAFL